MISQPAVTGTLTFAGLPQSGWSGLRNNSDSSTKDVDVAEAADSPTLLQGAILNSSSGSSHGGDDHQTTSPLFPFQFGADEYYNGAMLDHVTASHNQQHDAWPSADTLNADVTVLYALRDEIDARIAAATIVEAQQQQTSGGTTPTSADHTQQQRLAVIRVVPLDAPRVTKLTDSLIATHLMSESKRKVGRPRKHRSDDKNDDVEEDTTATPHTAGADDMQPVTGVLAIVCRLCRMIDVLLYSR